MNLKRFAYLGLLITALIVTACGPKATPAPTSTPKPEATLLPPTNTPAPTKAVLVTTVSEGEVPMGFTEEGSPYRGNPNASVTLLELSDFQCPYCARHTLQTGPLLYEAYIATGKVKHVFVQHPLASLHPQAPKAAEASLCAAKQGAKDFWLMHDLLFEKSEEWSGQENLTELFKGYAAELGLDTAAFVTCLESGETAAQVQSELERGEALGVSGVPAFFINDWFISGAQSFEEFQRVIEAVLKGEHPTPTPIPPPTPTPLPAGATIFDPNPERPGYTYGSDAFCGSEKAEIGLVEFVDFQSAENRKHFLEEWPELEKTYVGPGKVRLVVKHFPALEYTQGFTAAEAAECAGQQGAFCSMYDLLFTKQEEWSQADDVSAQLKKYAAELDLDAAAFATCLDEGQTSEKVMEDFAIGQDNQFPAAPLFFIFKGAQGGYVSLDQLKAAIEQLLAQ